MLRQFFWHLLGNCRELLIAKINFSILWSQAKVKNIEQESHIRICVRKLNFSSQFYNIGVLSYVATFYRLEIDDTSDMVARAKWEGSYPEGRISTRRALIINHPTPPRAFNPSMNMAHLFIAIPSRTQVSNTVTSMKMREKILSTGWSKSRTRPALGL